MFNMKRMKNVLLVSAVTSALVIMPVYAEPSAGSLESGRAAAQSEADAIQAELSVLLDEAGKLEADMIAKGEEISAAVKDLAEAKEEEKKQYEDMKLRIKYMYEDGNTNTLAALISAKNFSELINKAEYVKEVHSYDRKKLKEYEETKNKIEELKNTLETEQANMQAMQADYEEREAELNLTLESKRAEIAGYDTQIQEAAEAAARVAVQREQEADGQSDLDANLNGGSRNSGGNEDSVSDSVGGSYEPSGSTSAAQAIVNAAYGQLGVPYSWGGTAPGSGLDCSGLVQYCHSAAGISLPRTSQAQGGGGISVSNPQPGDVVCYGTHIGIYIGGGQMIHAPKPGDVVKVSNVYGSPWYRRYW